MKCKFKEGDKIRRISGEHQNMRKGDVDVVTRAYDSQRLDLKKYGVGHAPYNFELVDKPDVVRNHLRKGDLLRARNDVGNFDKGDVAEFSGYDSDGDLILRGLMGGWTPENWEFDKTPAASCLFDMDVSKEPEIEVGDTVIMVGYGWGIGDRDSDVAPLGVPVEVIEMNRDSKTYHLGFGDWGVSRQCVNRKAIRLISKGTKTKSMTVSEGPEVKAKSKFTKKGVVTDFLGLSTPITVEDQKTHANRVVRELARKHTGTISVCGGAPRNWQFNKSANDIDVYLYIRGANSEVIQGTLARYLGLEPRHIVRLGSGSAYYAQNNVKFVYESKLAGQKYQFIVTQGPIKDVEKDVLDFFNCDICKIAWDALNDTYHVTSEFKTDRDFKRLTYRMYALDKRNAELSMDKHVPKMMKQFPEFDVYIMRNPEHKVDDDGEFTCAD